METISSTVKLDLSKRDRQYYKASKKPELVDLDSYYYLSIEGQSSPDDSKFLDAIQAIYSIAYGIKFLCKGEDEDFVVPKMECHWFVDGGPEVQANFTQTSRDLWCWKILIRMPDFVEFHHYYRSMSKAINLKPEIADKIEAVKFELINEGRCAQILHIGSWDEEAENVNALHQYIWSNGLEIAGYHKEIYISDPRRVAEEKKQTILRYAVK